MAVRICAFVAAWAVLASAMLTCAAPVQPLPLPFEDTLRAARLDPAWTVGLSGDNQIQLADGGLKIIARQNTYAHIRRPLGTDLVRAEGPEEFGVLYDGTLELGALRARFEFGDKQARLGATSPCKKRLLDGSLPVVIAEGNVDALAIEQTAFAWSAGMLADAPPVVWLRVAVRNPSDKPVSLAAALRVVDDKNKDAREAAAWRIDAPLRSQREYAFRLSSPGWTPKQASCEELRQRLAECRRYWTDSLGRGMQIETPEPRVNSAYRAWLACNFINVDKTGGVYEPHDGGGGFYEAVFGYSAALLPRARSGRPPRRRAAIHREPHEDDRAYTYGHWMDCLRRDEVKRAILGLYGSLAYGMSRDTYAAVEVTRLRAGRNEMTLPHLYSNTQQIRLLRNMLVRESGDRLILAQAAPRPWLADGTRLCVRRAPTAFGEVGYQIESHAGAGRIVVALDPPTRRPPAEIELRLRHPEAAPIVDVMVDGKPHAAFTAEAIVLKPAAARVTVEARYATPQRPGSPEHRSSQTPSGSPGR